MLPLLPSACSGLTSPLVLRSKQALLGEVLLLLLHRGQCRISAPLPPLLCLKSRRGWQGWCRKERTANHISTCPTGSTAAGHPVCSPQPPKIAPRVVHAASNTAPNTPNNRIFPNAFGVVTAPWGKRAAQRALSARAARGWVCELQLPPRRLLGLGSFAFGQNPPAAGSGRACRQQRCGGAALGGAAGPRSAPAPRRLPAPGPRGLRSAPCGMHQVPGGGTESRNPPC